MFKGENQSGKTTNCFFVLTGITISRCPWDLAAMHVKTDARIQVQIKAVAACASPNKHPDKNEDEVG